LNARRLYLIALNFIGILLSADRYVYHNRCVNSSLPTGASRVTLARENQLTHTLGT